MLPDDGRPASNHAATEPDDDPFEGRIFPEELGDGPDLAFRRWLPDLRGRPTSS